VSSCPTPIRPLSTAGGIVETALLDGIIIAALEMIALSNTTVQR
jgi:hypothetical protein